MDKQEAKAERDTAELAYIKSLLDVDEAKFSFAEAIRYAEKRKHTYLLAEERYLEIKEEE